jgi:hypothetical protein
MKYGHNGITQLSGAVCNIRGREYYEALDRAKGVLIEGKQYPMRELLDTAGMPICGRWTIGKLYPVEAVLPGDKMLTSDDRGVKMIVNVWGFVRDKEESA